MRRVFQSLHGICSLRQKTATTEAQRRRTLSPRRARRPRRKNKNYGRETKINLRDLRVLRGNKSSLCLCVSVVYPTNSNTELTEPSTSSLQTGGTQFPTSIADAPFRCHRETSGMTTMAARPQRLRIAEPR